jgi:hypothetical protein
MIVGTVRISRPAFSRGPVRMSWAEGSTVIARRRNREAAIDYDSPRRPPVEDDDGLNELTVRSKAAQSPTADIDEAEDGFQLPDADPSGEELTVPVMPIRADELRCNRCFLVQHRSQFVARIDGQDVCRECS